MRFVSLFAGVGGFDIGLEAAGMTCIGQVEIDDKASTVLAAHWPEIPRHDDVCTAKEWADEHNLVGRTDLVCGGFPCQPFSVAGKRLGRDDLRGNLFWNALEFADHVRANWIVLENVPGLLTSGSPKGQDFADILQSLDEYGFDADWRVLDSQNFGVAQRRKRLFIIAHRRSAIRCGSSVFAEPEGGVGDLATLKQTWTPSARTVEHGSGDGRQLVADQGIVQALTTGLSSGGPDAQHAQAGWLIPEVEATYWDGGQVSDCLDVSMLSKGQMMPEKRRMPAVLVPYRKSRRPATDADYETWVEDPMTNTLNTFENASDVRATSVIVGFNPQNGGGYGNAHDGLGITEDGTGPLSTSQVPAVAGPVQYHVRRITPLEAERLQGWPDNWTLVDYRGKPMSDSQRYKQVGNGITAPVAEYVGRLVIHHHEATS